MNKSELIQHIADEHELSRAQASRIINTLFDPNGGVIARALKKGDAVSITGFGTFEQRKRGARTFRNPQTGEPVKAKASKVPAFRAGATLKGTVRGTAKGK
jgi:DNA-binding protein HU-beta